MEATVVVASRSCVGRSRCHLLMYNVFQQQQVELATVDQVEAETIMALAIKHEHKRSLPFQGQTRPKKNLE